MSWTKFLSLVVLVYLAFNALFALIYAVLVNGGALGLPEDLTFFQRFVHSFFFSVQTFTTVGYGKLSPEGLTANIVASIEALAGLMSFALAAGLLYGRFSKPSTKILFSEYALVAPYEEGQSLQFRIVNQRKNALANMQARVLMTVIDPETNNRSYYYLELEVSEITFFALNWTIVHKITEDSPLWGMTAETMKQTQTEFLILITGFDDVFSQNVQTRFSYRYDEIKWGERFVKAYDTTHKGDVVIDVRNIHKTEKV